MHPVRHAVVVVVVVRVIADVAVVDSVIVRHCRYQNCRHGLQTNSIPLNIIAAFGMLSRTDPLESSLATMLLVSRRLRIRLAQEELISNLHFVV